MAVLFTFSGDAPMLALGARAAFMFGRAGGYRLLSLFTVDSSLRDGSDSQYTYINLVPRVLHGRVGATGHGFRVFGICGGTQLGTHNRYDAAAQESVHPDT